MEPQLNKEREKNQWIWDDVLWFVQDNVENTSQNWKHNFADINQIDEDGIFYNSRLSGFPFINTG